jgi:peptidoglycan/LPS O-acetylase OafA/YrhL
MGGLYALTRHDSYYLKMQEVDWWWFSPVVGKGALAVDIFFVLSGFILAHVYKERFAQKITPSLLKGFYISRFARVYPMHFFVILVMVILYLTGGYSNELTSLSGLFFQLTLTEVWGIGNGRAWNRPAWSVSAEPA